MPERDYVSTPIADALGMREIIRDLAADLADLRGGRITVNDALARAAIAKQIWNGVRIYMAVEKPPRQAALTAPEKETVEGGKG